VIRSKPYIIGIAGTTCSGKSELARCLAGKLAEEKPVIISADAYYRDLSGLEPPERKSMNFDTPDAIEAELLHQDLAALAQGDEIDAPFYDFSTHTRTAHSTHVVPGKVVIV